VFTIAGGADVKGLASANRIPGLHRTPLKHRNRSDTQSRRILPAEVDVSCEVPVPLPAGGTMFHHSLLIHRSHPNSSPRYR
jgi:Phytanoyl-CoA dioxygenase (PhyH)